MITLSQSSANPRLLYTLASLCFHLLSSPGRTCKLYSPPFTPSAVALHDISSFLFLTNPMLMGTSFVALLLLPLGLSFSLLLRHLMAPPSQCLHEHPSPSNASSPWTNVDGEQVRARLLQMLNSRRRSPVEPPELLPAQSHRRPYLQEEAESFVHPELLALCPKAEGAWRHRTRELEEEDLILRVEAGEQGNVPFLVIRPKPQQHSPSKEILRRPAVICMHSTGRSKESMRPFMEAYASLGYVTVAVDARYHGDRGRSRHAYANGLIAGWKTGQTLPFIFDTVWDIIKIVDYLTGRPDVDPERIGMMGISLGGMHTWFAAAADPRIATAVPLIGVQSFGWAIANEQWHARVMSIPLVFEVAAQDLGKDEVDSETVAAVWQRLAPGLMDFLDSPQTVPAIAPRPLLIYNGKEDPRCPILGLTETLSRSAKMYKEAGVPKLFQFIAEEGLGHAVSEEMGEETISWFNKHLRPSEVTSGPYWEVCYRKQLIH